MDRIERIEGLRRTRHLIRAITAMGAAPGHQRALAVQIAKARWPKDLDTVETIERSASTITSTGTSGLAPPNAVADLVSLLGPISASSAIFNRCPIQLSFAGVSAIVVPTVVAAPTGFGFIAQGAPVPIRQLSFSAPTLTSKKAGAGWTMTREMMEASNGEVFVRAAAAESLSDGLDSILLDANPADALRPAGLRSYAASLTPTALAANVTQQDAFEKDVGALALNVSAVASSLQNIIFIASPDVAIRLGLRTNYRFGYDLFASSGLPANTLMALAVNAFAVAADPAPIYSVSKTTSIHMEDSAPAQLATSPGVYASPTRSTWQTDTCVAKIILDIDWAMRSSAGVSWCTGLLW
jgi:hypothetical protein